MVVVINPSEGKPSMGKSIRNLSTVTRVGLDLAKNAFQVHAVDATGAIVVARKLTRGRLVPFFAELAPCVVAIEACSSASLGTGADRTRARGSIAAARACEALCPAQQERRDRCGGDLRGGGAAGPAAPAGAVARQPG